MITIDQSDASKLAIQTQLEAGLPLAVAETMLRLETSGFERWTVFVVFAIPNLFWFRSGFAQSI